MASEPAPLGAVREPVSPVGILLVVLDRGRAVEDASLREGPLGAPEARFLLDKSGSLTF